MSKSIYNDFSVLFCVIKLNWSSNLEVAISPLRAGRMFHSSPSVLSMVSRTERASIMLSSLIMLLRTLRWKTGKAESIGHNPVI